MQAYQAVCAEVVSRVEAMSLSHLGDGVLAYFGWPAGRDEDDAEPAVRAGLAMIDRSSGSIVMRTCSSGACGIATGIVVVGDLIGEGASRGGGRRDPQPRHSPSGLAEPGHLVISQATRRLVGGLFEFADLGPQRLKGFAEPIMAWRVAGESRAEGRFEARQTTGLTPLVGREQEMALLLDRWQRAKDGGARLSCSRASPATASPPDPQLARAARGRARPPLSHFCSPLHQTDTARPPDHRPARARGRLRRNDPPGASSPSWRRCSPGAPRAWPRPRRSSPPCSRSGGGPLSAAEPQPAAPEGKDLRGAARPARRPRGQQPVLALYEDVYWSDPTTLELLDLVVERVQRLPRGASVTFRPELLPPGPALLTSRCSRSPASAGARAPHRLSA